MNTIGTQYLQRLFAYGGTDITSGMLSGQRDFLAALTRMESAAANATTKAGANTAHSLSSSAAMADLESSGASALAGMQLTGTSGIGSAQQTSNVSLQDMLEARYPGIHYHVFDASSSNWKTRTDYPHYLLYQDGDKAKEVLENWKPEGENPFYGSKNGQFIAPNAIRQLEHVAPGSKAVVIHPKVQERMESDPAYATEIFNRIEAWFALDVARNDVIRAAHGDPSCEGIMSQAVAIGEDGTICNAQASSQGRITYSESGSSSRDGRQKSGWDARLERHDALMERIVEEQIAHKISVSKRTNALAEKRAILQRMLQENDLKSIFGETIGGNPTETILALAAGEAAGALGI